MFAFAFPIPFWQTGVAQNFDVTEWVAPIILIAAYVILGVTLWGLSVELIGIGISSAFFFGISSLVYTTVNAAFYENLFNNGFFLNSTSRQAVNYSDMVINRFNVTGNGTLIYFNTIGIVTGVVTLIGFLVVVISLVTILVISIVIEFQTFKKRCEVEDHYMKLRAIKNRRKGKEPKLDEFGRPIEDEESKHASKVRIRTQWYLGLFLATVSGLCGSCLLLGLFSAEPLITKMQNNVPMMTYFQCRIVIGSLGLLFGSVLTFMLSLFLLLARQSFKRFVCISGNPCLLLDKCSGLKPVRILGIVSGFVMSFLAYGGFVMIVFGESQSPIETGFHLNIMGTIALVITSLLSLCFREMMDGTSVGVKITMLIVYVLLFFGMAAMTIGTAVY